MDSSIFISIASYCDPLLGFTVGSALEQARWPDALRFGVVEQAMPGEELVQPTAWPQRALRWQRVPALESQGACWARAQAMRLWQGESWYLQVDSHTWFGPGWDEELLHWGHWAQAPQRQHGSGAQQGSSSGGGFIISTYPQAFEWQGSGAAAGPVAQPVWAEAANVAEAAGDAGNPTLLALVARADAAFAPAGHPVLPFEAVPVASAVPLPAIHVAAGALWAPGALATTLPYDGQFYFHGEEQALALKAWTRGWDLWHVPGLPLHHQYHDSQTGRRPLHWSPAHDELRRERWTVLEERSLARLTRLMAGDSSLGGFGLGTVRSLADWAAYSGIDYAARTIGAMARRGRFGLGPLV